MTHKNERVLSVAELARVEGQGALYIRTSGNKVEEARLDPCISCAAHFLNLTVERSLLDRTDGGSSFSSRLRAS